MDVVLNPQTSEASDPAVGDPAFNHQPAGDPAPASRIVAPLAIIGTAIALTAGFLPFLFNSAQAYDDEGALLLGIREFITHGSLYHHSTGYYGPFWYSLFGALYRIIGTDPTPFSGRLIVLLLTGLTTGIFAATVYRLTRSVAAAVLCEVASFCTLIRVAGIEPMHPASIILTLLALLLYCLTSNCIAPRRTLVAVAGFATAAIVMTKINVGLFVVVAIAIWIFVGNQATPRFLRVAVIAGSVIFPFALVSQNIWNVWAGVYALVVSVSVLLICVVASSGSPLPNAFAIWPFVAGAGATVLASVVWPLAYGTPVRYLVNGIFIRPLNQANALTAPAFIRPSWPMFLVAAIGVALAAFWREPRVAGHPIRDEHWGIALGVTGLAVLGLGSFGGFASWLPAIVLLPAIATFIKADRTVLSLLVLTVGVAVVQTLHAYPVAGSQVAWGTVAMFVPCAIAIGFGLHGLPDWRRLRPSVRASATVATCAFLMIGTGFWPLAAWHDYLNNPQLGLRGTTLMRLPPTQTSGLRRVTSVLRRNCDTFYSVPPSDSFYIYADLPSPSGLTVNWWNQLNPTEQLHIVDSLKSALQRHERVCILGEGFASPLWAASQTGQGPLGAFVSSFDHETYEYGTYTVCERSPAPNAFARSYRKKVSRLSQKYLRPGGPLPDTPCTPRPSSRRARHR